MNNFREDILRFFPYLFEKYKFEFVNQSNDFGGNVILAQSEKLRVRFIRDRADFFLDMSRNEEPEKWVSFYKIMDQLSAKGKINIQYKYSNQMSIVSQLLGNFFPDIKDFFSE